MISYIPNAWQPCSACGTISPPARLKDGKCIDAKWCRRVRNSPKPGAV